MINEKPASPTQGDVKAALDCVVHALMALPVPIDGQGKRAWASLHEAQTFLESALDRTTLPPTEDMVLVPREPTPEMYGAGGVQQFKCDLAQTPVREAVGLVYRAMLAAALTSGSKPE